MENDTIKILSIEEADAVQRLNVIQGQISDAFTELSKLQKELPEVYEKKKIEEEKAIADALSTSKALFEEAKGYYTKLIAFEAQVNSVLNAITKLGNSITIAGNMHVQKSDMVVKLFQELKDSQNSFRKEIHTENRKLDSKKQGLDSLEQAIIVRAGEVQGRVDALNQIKQ